MMSVSRINFSNMPPDSDYFGQFIKLKQLHQPVKDLYYVGGNLLELLSKPKVAIIGSRKPTAYGISITKRLTRELSQAGIVIVSGLALGIDSIAHQAALDAGGSTIAILPSPVTNIYPKRHQALAQRIIKQGSMLCSEYRDGSGWPQKHQFIARNRIIAALADIVVITEATEKSGSLHTANFALDLATEVMAVPGNISSLQSAGTNSLIQKGATPVLAGEDILNCLH